MLVIIKWVGLQVLCFATICALKQHNNEIRIYLFNGSHSSFVCRPNLEKIGLAYKYKLSYFILWEVNLLSKTCAGSGGK